MLKEKKSRSALSFLRARFPVFKMKSHSGPVPSLKHGSWDSCWRKPWFPRLWCSRKFPVHYEGVSTSLGDFTHRSSLQLCFPGSCVSCLPAEAQPLGGPGGKLHDGRKEKSKYFSPFPSGSTSRRFLMPGAPAPAQGGLLWFKSPWSLRSLNSNITSSSTGNGSSFLLLLSLPHSSLCSPASPMPANWISELNFLPFEYQNGFYFPGSILRDALGQCIYKLFSLLVTDSVAGIHYFVISSGKVGFLIFNTVDSLSLIILCLGGGLSYAL